VSALSKTGRSDPDRSWVSVPGRGPRFRGASCGLRDRTMVGGAHSRARRCLPGYGGERRSPVAEEANVPCTNKKVRGVGVGPDRGAYKLMTTTSAWTHAIKCMPADVDDLVYTTFRRYNPHTYIPRSLSVLEGRISWIVPLAALHPKIQIVSYVSESATCCVTSG
jgi:hypothetical protein